MDQVTQVDSVTVLFGNIIIVPFKLQAASLDIVEHHFELAKVKLVVYIGLRGWLNNAC